MAGYGNANAPDISPADLEPQHSQTRFGRTDTHPYSNPHETYGSGTTGGAGFGNKSAPDPDPTARPSPPSTPFASHASTAPYTGGTRHGSGSTGGAGYGNKTGSFSASHDSAVGKVIEKVGRVVGREGVVEKGRGMREAKGLGKEGEGETPPGELEGRYEAN